MELKKKDGLIIEALIDGPADRGKSTFLLLLVGPDQKRRYAIFQCRPNHAEGIAKAFGRIIAVRPPGWTQEEISTPQDNEAPEDTRNKVGVHERRTYEQTWEDFSRLAAEQKPNVEELREVEQKAQMPLPFEPCESCEDPQEKVESGEV